MSSLIVSTAELADNLGNPTWRVFDCRHDLLDIERGTRLYREGHIPGAQFAAVEMDLSGTKTGTNGRHPLPLPGAFTEFLATRGVASSSKVIAYDDAGGLYAARLWWLCRWVGLKDVALLDGGIPKWVAEGRGLTTDIPTTQRTQFAGRVQPSRVLSAAEVLGGLNNSDVALIDARAAERFRGDVEPMDPFAGHIPGALNRFYKNNLNADLTFRSPEELEREFGALLAHRRAENVGHYCGSGITACANLFAMEYAGLTGSKLYSGSWSEWVADSRRPTTPARIS